MTESGRDRLLANLLALSLRQVVMGVTTLCGLVALARLLSPADFALYGYATATMLIAASIGDLGLGAGLIKEGAPDSRIRSSFGLQLAIWVPLCVGVVALASVSDPYGLSGVASALLAACFLVFALQALPTALLERARRFGTIAQLESLQRIVFVVAAVVFALLAWGDIAVALAGAVAGIVGYAVALAATRWRWLPRLAGASGVFGGFSSSWWRGRVASQLNYAVYPLLGGLLFTREQVGWLVWALAVTSIPAMLAPLSARVLLPNLVAVGEVRRLATFSRLFRALLLVSLPAVAALFACARPITVFFFGEDWLSAVPILRLECITSVLGVVLTPVVPLLFLASRPELVSRLLIAWAAAVWLGALALSGVADYYAPSLAQIAAALVALVVFDRLLARAHSYSLIREAAPAVLVCVVFALAGWLAAAELATDALRTIIVCAAVLGAALAATAAVTRGVDLRRARAIAASVGPF